ncbi:hypothetical protein HDU91_005354 [Kappamyces sp. JEL0680]|nr:hypothetical protein HDU91_005354 [Kappamyces sp. JEL0680]
MHGLVDHSGTLQARGHLNWIPLPAPEHTEGQPPSPPEPLRVSSTSKLQAQLSTRSDQSQVLLEHEHNGGDYSVNVKAVNMNPFDTPTAPNGVPSVTGIFTASLLQALSKSLAVGVEWTLQRPQPTIQESAWSYSLRWAPPPTSELPAPSTLPPGAPSPYMPLNPKDPHQVFTTTWAPGSGMLHSSYWRRLNQRLEMVAELQMLLTPAGPRGENGRREDTKTSGFATRNIMGTKASLRVQDHEKSLKTYQWAKPDGTLSTHQRHFCSFCGSSLWAYDERWPEWVYPFATCVDTVLPDVAEAEQIHIMLDSKIQPCVHVPAASSCFAEYPSVGIEEWHKKKGLWVE